MGMNNLFFNHIVADTAYDSPCREDNEPRITQDYTDFTLSTEFRQITQILAHATLVLAVRREHSLRDKRGQSHAHSVNSVNFV